MHHHYQHNNKQTLGGGGEGAVALPKAHNSAMQWRNYERRSEAIASGCQAAGGARGRFWSTDCLLCTTEFSQISKERKKLKNKQN